MVDFNMMNLANVPKLPIIHYKITDFPDLETLKLRVCSRDDKCLASDPCLPSK